MTTNVVVIFKRKIIATDALLPILMELQARYPDIRIKVLFPDQSTRKTVQKNHHIWDRIQSLSSTISTQNISKFEAINYINRLLFFIRLIGRKNIIIKSIDPFPPLYCYFIKILRLFSETIEINERLYAVSLEALQLEHDVRFRLLKSIYRAQGRDENTIGYEVNRHQYDYVISNFSYDPFVKYAGGKSGDEMDRDKLMTVGYFRRLPLWTRFLKEKQNTYKPVTSGNYFLYFLNTAGQTRPGRYNEPDYIDLIEETLLELKQYNKIIKTIFKPHPNIDSLDRHEELLSRIGYENYIIDNGHPMVLSANAHFVIGNSYSTTMFDAYYQGVPVLEYFQYDQRLYEGYGRQSMGGRCCDFPIHRNRKQLKEVLKNLMHERVRLRRDPEYIDENFPPTPEEFWDFWNKLLL